MVMIKHKMLAWKNDKKNVEKYQLVCPSVMIPQSANAYITLQITDKIKQANASQ
jgi:hypothetical protein